MHEAKLAATRPLVTALALLVAGLPALPAYGQAAYRHRMTAPAPVEGGDYGNLVVGLNDVDGDGRGDFAVAEPGASRLHVYSGGTLDLLHTHEVGNATVIEATPDYDGDGIEDLLLGVTPVRLHSTATGALLRTYEPPEPFDLIHNAAAVPDADGDGVFDVLIAEEGSSEERVHLLSGATGLPLHLFLDPMPPSLFGNGFGRGLGGVPDTDGDGRGDVLIGAPGTTAGGVSGKGWAHLFSGATGALLQDWDGQVDCCDYPAQFGKRVRGMPDVNGDGRGDVLISAPNADFDGGFVGLYSGATGVTIADWRGGDYQFFGQEIAAIPDFDGDDRWDVMIYGPGDKFRDWDDIYVYSSTGAGGVSLPDPRLTGALAGVPDFDGDGLAELLVGCELAQSSTVGCVYLFPSAERPLPTVTVEPVDPPVVIPPEGGAFSFTTRVRSQSEIWQRWFVWAQAYRDGVPVGEELPPQALPLGPGQDTTVVREQVVAGSAPAGEYTYRVYVGDYPDLVAFEDAFPFTKAQGTAVEPPPGSAAPTLSAAPNPAMGPITLTVALPMPGPARLTLHDALGREVAILCDGPFGEGAHGIPLDASRLAPGVYVARLEAGGGVVTRRVVVAR